MTEKLREQISALADDELPVGEHELLTRRFGSDRYLFICWERYHMIGEAMRKALPHVDTFGFADRVMAVLFEAPAEQKRHSLTGYFGKIAAGVAVASCVAVAALIGLRHNDAHLPLALAPTETVPPSPPLQTSLTAYGRASNASWNGNLPDVRAELSNYIINHNEASAALGKQGMLPYFYITTYPTGVAMRTRPAVQQKLVKRPRQ
ncbi:MAG: sigma-E factor negative regulatory protein [Gammaproteobacteria bacterium]